ncbi:3-oxoacyl-ACP reductase FabG [Alkalicoccus saliphilus]|uniref:3-oxoacyl-ACP reductase FabG n=1 Tax=Alkalicoccus saliphilus TaxID=200989 RepID=A0A2T4U3L2_9BACI|nr:3-oxoacyl-ACP reductase FabG [Alkalicoccus saliphilus]PTL37998.1 3-oxoacyl-ACP reductase FabG [Alkalicoccus saliphilus]
MFSNQVALITGASQGIGKEIAYYFAERGARVIVNYPFESEYEKAQAVVESIQKAGGWGEAIQADVGKEDEVKNMFEQIKSKYNALHILVNNAGITKDSSIKKMSVEQYSDVIHTNLTGSFLTLKEASLIMGGQSYGRIINTSSISGLHGNFGQANYASAKAGIVGLTKTAAIEYARKGVTVNAIAPGFIRTPMTDQIPDDIKTSMISEIPVQRIGEPVDIASAAAFLASEEAGYITGQILSVNGGSFM